MSNAQQIIYRSMTEKHVQDTAIQALILHGYTLIFHDYDSKRNARGYLDLHAIRLPSALWDADYMVVECKTERGRLRAEQKLWIAGYQANGIACSVLRPSQLDEFIKRLQRGRKA